MSFITFYIEEYIDQCLDYILRIVLIKHYFSLIRIKHHTVITCNTMCGSQELAVVAFFSVLCESGVFVHDAIFR